MTSEKDALYRAVTFNLDDDTPRQIYTEWLAENGFTDQANFIRIQLMLARGLFFDLYGNPLPSTPQVVAEFEAEAKRLLDAHRTEWEAPIQEALGATCQEITFHRGFPRDVRVSLVEQLIASRILESPINTLTGLSVRNLGNQLRNLLSHPGIARLTKLDLTSNHIRLEGAEAIANCPYLANLQVLNLQNNGIGVVETRAIARSRYLSNLTTLGLWDNQIGDAGARAIAESPYLAKLTVLDLNQNYIADEGAKAISRSQHLTTLKSLNLRDNGIGAAGAIAVARSRNLKNLLSLNLQANDIWDEGAKAIANSPHLANLNTLNLTNNNIWTAGARAIANSPYLSKLTVLELRDNHIGDEGAEAIAASQHLSLPAKLSGLRSAGFDTLADKVEREAQGRNDGQEQPTGKRRPSGGGTAKLNDPPTKRREQTLASSDEMDPNPNMPGSRKWVR